ncbi:hypothetical protein E1H99_11145 [Enterococcus hirae]|nr:hypothetical protein E1H99_11145 [Enterococcus hirae]
MKKNILANLLCGAVLVSGSLIGVSEVFADAVDNVGTTTIDNSTDPIVTDWDWQFKGSIGAVDNTDPDGSVVDPDQWINVSVPTNFIFHSTENSDHEDIVSADHSITNHSGRPVKIEVKELKNVNNPSGVVDTLSLNQSGTKILDLIVGGQEQTISPTALTTLASPNATGTDFTGPTSVALQVVGKTDTTKFDPTDKDTSQTVDFKLGLHFEAQNRTNTGPELP